MFKSTTKQMLHRHGPSFKLWSISLQRWESMLNQTLQMDSSSSCYRFLSTLSRVGDLCNLGGFPSFGPGVRKAREFSYSLLIFEEKRLCKARQRSQLMPALPWLAPPGKYRRLDNSRLGGSLSGVGMEARTLLVKSNEV